VTVTFSEVDRTNVTLNAAVDIVDPSFNESLLKDFPNDQRNFNRLSLADIGSSTSDPTKIFVPSLEGKAEVRLHVNGNSNNIAGFAEHTWA
jgi:hypothetical protein